MSEHIAEVSRGMPRLIVASRVIEKIKRGALLYPEPETGEAMIGLIVPQTGQAEPDIYIFDTISPGDRAIREWGMFEQGDDWQADVFNWLWINWEAYRSLRRGSYGRAVAAKWDAPLQHVGDWHKQPDDMIAPSGGDAQTARRMIDDRDTTVEHIVAPIVTMYPLAKATPVTDEKEQQSSEKSSASTDNASNDSTEVDSDQPTQSDHHPASNSTNTEMTSAGSATITGETLRARGYPSPPPLVANALQFTLEEDGWIVRVDFWYMSKRSKRFSPVIPEIWEDDRLPSLPPVAWHLAQPRRFEQETNLLIEAGYQIDIVRWDADGKPPFEICFSVYKPGRRHVILLVTSAEYPTTQPAVRVAPLVSVEENEDVFEKLYEASWPVMITEMPDWPWDSKRTLVELVWHVEKYLAKDKANDQRDSTS